MASRVSIRQSVADFFGGEGAEDFPRGGRGSMLRESVFGSFVLNTSDFLEKSQQVAAAAGLRHSHHLKKVLESTDDQELLMSMCDLEDFDSDFDSVFTPLHVACLNGNYFIFKILAETYLQGIKELGLEVEEREGGGSACGASRGSSRANESSRNKSSHRRDDFLDMSFSPPHEFLDDVGRFDLSSLRNSAKKSGRKLGGEKVSGLLQKLQFSGKGQLGKGVHSAPLYLKVVEEAGELKESGKRRKRRGRRASTLDKSKQRNSEKPAKSAPLPSQRVPEREEAEPTPEKDPMKKSKKVRRKDVSDSSSSSSSSPVFPSLSPSFSAELRKTEKTILPSLVKRGSLLGQVDLVGLEEDSSFSGSDSESDEEEGDLEEDQLESQELEEALGELLLEPPDEIEDSCLIDLAVQSSSEGGVPVVEALLEIVLERGKGSDAGDCFLLREVFLCCSAHFGLDMRSVRRGLAIAAMQGNLGLLSAMIKCIEEIGERVEAEAREFRRKEAEQKKAERQIRHSLMKTEGEEEDKERAVVKDREVEEVKEQVEKGGKKKSLVTRSETLPSRLSWGLTGEQAGGEDLRKEEDEKLAKMDSAQQLEGLEEIAYQQEKTADSGAERSLWNLRKERMDEINEEREEEKSEGKGRDAEKEVWEDVEGSGSRKNNTEGNNERCFEEAVEDQQEEDLSALKAKEESKSYLFNFRAPPSPFNRLQTTKKEEEEESESSEERKSYKEKEEERGEEEPVEGEVQTVADETKQEGLYRPPPLPDVTPLIRRIAGYLEKEAPKKEKEVPPLVLEVFECGKFKKQAQEEGGLESTTEKAEEGRVGRRTLLHDLAMVGEDSEEVVAKLLGFGMEIIEDQKGWTPLHAAAMKGARKVRREGRPEAIVECNHII